jgi:hypothetical protein
MPCITRWPPGGDCCQVGAGADVLIWSANQSRSITGGALVGIKNTYTAMGLTVHEGPVEFSGNIHDYFLIHWLAANSDPPWWDAITEGEWSGRFHLTCDAGASLTGTLEYVNNLSGLTGVTVNPGFFAGFPHNGGSVEDDDLTAGVGFFNLAGTSGIHGGTTLSKTLNDNGIYLKDEPWLARSTMGQIDFVVSGTAGYVLTNAEGFGWVNIFGTGGDGNTYLQNLYTVPIA